MLGAQGIRATGFKHAQGNAHCAKFESHTNRVTFETNAIRVTSSVQALSYPMLSFSKNSFGLLVGNVISYFSFKMAFTFYGEDI